MERREWALEHSVSVEEERRVGERRWASERTGEEESKARGNENTNKQVIDKRAIR